VEKLIKNKKIVICIDSPSAAGAGSISKLLATHYSLAYLDSGKCYRFCASLKIKYPNEYNYSFLKKKIIKLNPSELQNKYLLSEKVAAEASIIAKDIKIRKIVNIFQQKIINNPKGAVCDGRDMCTNLAPWTPFKFYVTASVKVRSLRRFKELKKLKKKINLAEVRKSIEKRDKSDRTRPIAPLIRAPQSILINTSNLSIRSGFLKIKKMIDKKLYS
tara:strand:- start:38 stop:688 length:651 start_codon:yes stop_codon:yes gene_type:complete